MNHLLHHHGIAAVVVGGFFMAIAAALMQRVVDPEAEREPHTIEIANLHAPPK